MGYKQFLDKIIWSFSTLSLYEECPYSFYLKKIEEIDEEENYYAENGTAMHEVLADILTNEVKIDDAPSVYAEKYDLICAEVAQSTMDKKFEACADYLCEVEPPPDDIEVLGVEMKLEFHVGEFPFTGRADAVLRSKTSGKVWLVDHKSCTHFFGKSGQPLKATLKKYNSYKKQMYLYCYGLKEQFDISVDYICWNHFCDGGALSIIPFDQKEMNEVLQWATDLVESIYNDWLFEACDPRNNYFQCHQICGYRSDCMYLYYDSNFSDYDEDDEE